MCLHLWLQYCFPRLLDYGKHWEEILKFLFFLSYVRQDKIIEQCHFVYDKVHHNYNKIRYTIQSNSIPKGVRWVRLHIGILSPSQFYINLFNYMNYRAVQQWLKLHKK